MVHTTTIAVANVVANLNAAENAVATKPTRATVPSNRFINRIFPFKAHVENLGMGFFVPSLICQLRTDPLNLPSEKISPSF